MTDKKLIPRVGDRVLVKVRYTAIPDSPTYVGTVIKAANTEYTCLVQIDGKECSSFINETWLTVVDRDPVEWPEGWSGYKLYPAVFHEPTNVAISKDGLRQLLLTGPDMLRDWDELMGGAE